MKQKQFNSEYQFKMRKEVRTQQNANFKKLTNTAISQNLKIALISHLPITTWNTSVILNLLVFG